MARAYSNIGGLHVRVPRIKRILLYSVLKKKGEKMKKKIIQKQKRKVFECVRVWSWFSQHYSLESILLNGVT